MGESGGSGFLCKRCREQVGMGGEGEGQTEKVPRWPAKEFGL